MGSFKGDGREDGSKRRPGDPRRARRERPNLEGLEKRRLLASSVTINNPPPYRATSTDPYNVQSGPLADLGPQLIQVYHDYVNFETAGGQGTFVDPLIKQVFFDGSAVGVDARGYGNFTTFEQSLQKIGMIVYATDPALDIVEGFVPPQDLPSLAKDSQFVGADPTWKPNLNVGSAQNQAVNTLAANMVQTGLGIDGTGQKIAAISDSFSEFGGGYQQSITSGDLPSGVFVLQDEPAGAGNPTDEGRAMLENIHDIAPGAGLGFATGFVPDVQFANNITQLGADGFKTIVDDLSDGNDPYFQDGVIQQAINAFVAGGGTYLSSAGNHSDGGYLSNFRPVTATVSGIGTGTFQNFDPTGTTVQPTLGIQVYNGQGANLELQFDDPSYTSSGVVSNVNFYVLDSNNNIVAQGNANNIATQSPIQILPTVTADGLYKVAIQVVSGPAPNHVVFYERGDGFVAVDQSHGSAGGTYYPTTYGHNAGGSTIGVAAVPFWDASPYTNPSTVYTEPFSSAGPNLSVFAPNGTPLPTPVLLQKPDIAGPDGGVTSFFGGINLDTSNPPFPPAAYTGYNNTTPTVQGEVATTTNLNVQPTFQSFFGTSSAAPNIAAVVALMKEANPGISNASILTDLKNSATPLNGATKGNYQIQGGFGLVNALTAVQLAQQLQVTFISPGGSQVVTQAPTSLIVTFNKPINFSLLSKNFLQVFGVNGSTVTTGTPIALGSNPAFPTQVQVPITITPAPGKVANGIYRDYIAAGTVTSQSGQVLANPVSDSFNLEQTVPPVVKSVSYVARVVQVTFSEPMNPASINAATFSVFRAGGLGLPFGPNSISLAYLPGVTISYDPATFTAKIDLSALSQAQLPSDHYRIVASSDITDSVGNRLNGSFNGVFPSGTNPATAATFVDDLGNIGDQAPIISYVSLAPASDSGIQGDNNTASTTPSITGQITSTFPGSLAGVLIYVQFNGIAHANVPTGGLNLGVGSGGRGFVGTYDATAVTNATGGWTVNYPAGVSPLPEGLNQVRVLAQAPSDQPPFPGFSSAVTYAFRVAETLPYVGTPNGGQASSIPQGGNINGLTTLTLDVIDPVNPQALSSPFAVDPKFSVPALNPSTADNTSNYRLLLVSGNGTIDESKFIATATFASTTSRTLSSDPYTGTVTLTFLPGLPTGSYKFLALSSGTTASGQGLTDAAGNAFGGYQLQASLHEAYNYELDFNLQPTPTYITAYTALAQDPTQPNNPAALETSGPRAVYEIPAQGVTPRAPAPPTAFAIDFSNSLNPNVNYTPDVLLVRSANSANATPDGNFGDLGITNTSGYTLVQGYSVTLGNSVAGAQPGQFGYDNRLTLTLATGTTLPADYYRFYLPNKGPTAITDIFGNQLDGEFLGYQNAQGFYVDQLPNGTIRGSAAEPDLTGDGNQGGAFMTGFEVVPNGNIIYAQADALYNPLIPADTPDGSLAKPYPVLAPEAVPNAANGGDLNSVVNSGANFNPIYDRSGNGVFEPSAFYAAQVRLQETGGPVAIFAEASVPSIDPSTGQYVQKPFVLQAPAGSDPNANDASAAVPAMTTLVFEAGSILKMQNAALLIQNQGSALQVLGGPNAPQQVNITSYKDSSVGGVSNGNPNSVPQPGDYGGIVFRNFSQAPLPGSTTARTTLFPGQLPLTGNPSVDDRLKGVYTTVNGVSTQSDAVSGADDIMSYITNLVEKYAGGPVPQTNGVRYDGVTIQNSRPTIVNTIIADAGGSGSAQAGLSVDVNSLRADDVAQGPLLRNDQFLNNGLNGIYIRAELNGLAEPTNAVAYPTNPSTDGGSRNFILDDPYPYLLTSELVIGQQLQVETGGLQSGSADRLYIQPGMLVKFEHGASLTVNANASLNVGDTTYIKEYDANPTFGPTFAATLPNGSANPLAGQTDPNFVAESTNLAKVVFTSLNDDTASTSYFDTASQTTTTIVAPLAAVPGGSGTLQPTPGNVPAAARWGGFTIASGAVAVINDAVFRYGGGEVNTPSGTGTEPVLTLLGDAGGDGSHVLITNNSFSDNSSDPTVLNDAPIVVSPDALLAADPQRPLSSGDPFIHGNVFTRNGFNGVRVLGGTDGLNIPNLHVNSVWTGSDFTYILTNTIVLGPFGNGGIPQIPNGASLTAEPEPSLTLTLQSTLPGTILADGSVVAAPGVPLIIKLDGSAPTETPLANPAAAIPNSYLGGAGFIVGVDNGIDPPADQFVDNGAFAALRIVGIAANQSTGQQRVPVEITSIHDSSVGTTVNNVAMNQAIPGDTQAPAAGDGGVIYYGGNSAPDYSFQDPRSGSIIDNADIKYISRIEQQGGGIFYAASLTPGGTTVFNPTNDNPFAQKVGESLPIPVSPTQNVSYVDQYNQPKKLVISDSNLSTFRDEGFFAHPGYDALGVATNYNPGQNNPVYGYRIAGFLGQPTQTYFVNDTISNMTSGTGTGVVIVSENSANSASPSPAMAVFLNDTFYNDTNGIHTVSPAYDGTNSLSHTATLVMDSIFSNISGTAIQADGQDYSSESQYNLFYLVGTSVVGMPNNDPVSGNPDFRDPANGNFNLGPNSAAIDRARSELGPSIFGDMLYPSVTVDVNNINAIPTRNQIGDLNPFGGLGTFQSQLDLVTLPGEPVSERGFPDQWIPVLQPTPGPSGVITANQAVAGTIGTAGTTTNAGTYLYAPIVGERDINGNLRVKDPNSPNVGYGSRPFFDLGAYEYIIQNPPVVESVTATVTDPTSPTGTSQTNLYSVGGIAGTNKLPQSIQIQFSDQLNTATLNGMSVILLASGGAGVFNDPTNPLSRAISLTGDLSFNSTTDILTIDTSHIFLAGLNNNDEYRLILEGTGSNPIKDKSGLALDGLNLDASGKQLPLPSGSDQFPGSNFQVTFTIDTHSPSIVPGTFKLAPSSDSSGGLGITNVTKPTFVGTITDIFPPANPLVGDTVQIDVSSQGNGVFDLIDAGTGTTDANGNFSVTLTTPIPNTPNTVGTNGIQGGPGATFTEVRVRIIDAAGNPSNLITDPYSSFVNEGAATQLQVDTKLPDITAFSPLGNVLATPNSDGTVSVSVTFDKNIKASTLNANSIQVVRTGGTGSFANPVAVPILAGSFTTTYLKDATGSETVTFKLQGPLTNDEYRITLKGTGSTPITDLAANPLSGAFSGTFPTGNGTTGSDFVNLPFTIYSPANSKLIFVEAGATATTGTLGSRENPYSTIAAGLNAAKIGDDVLVLPGTYAENVTLKAGVRLLSADASSTDTSYVPGSVLQTLIYGTPSGYTRPLGIGLPVTDIGNITVIASNLQTIPGIITEISGFSIISPLLGSSVNGVIDSTSSAIEIENSSVLVDRNYVLNAGIGVNIGTAGTKAVVPIIANDVIVGNINGIGISDTNSTLSLLSPVAIINNTIADNTYGLYNVSSTPGQIQANLFNNIFYNNHDLTTARNGTGILSEAVNTLIVGSNLFYNNGASSSVPADNAIGTFQVFNPSNLKTTTIDGYGNLLGNPAFVAARDPRPNGDTPPVFFLDGSYDLTSYSAAIDLANNPVAPPTDFLYRGRVKIAGKGFSGTGPTDAGAFEYKGTGGIPLGGVTPPTSGTGVTGTGTTSTGTGTGTGTGGGSGGSSGGGSGGGGIFGTGGGGGGSTVTTSSVSAASVQTSAHFVATAPNQTAPSYIDVTFGTGVSQSEITPGDLLLSGTGLNPLNPAHASSLSWIDANTVRFFLTGAFNPTGTIEASIPDGQVVSNSGTPLSGASETFQLVPSTVSASGIPLPTQPTAVAGPVAFTSTVTLPHLKNAKHAKASHVKVHADHVHPVKAAKSKKQTHPTVAAKSAKPTGKGKKA
jgi:hypothetical protein